LLKKFLLYVISKLFMQNLKLQVLWLDDSLGLAVNQKTPESLVPLTSYYFWPVSEAWEQIRFELDAKPWIPEEERVRLLNSIVEVMKKWQKSRAIPNGKTNIQYADITTDNVTVVGLP